MDSPTKKLPSVLKHFELPENVSGNFKATCKYCKKLISGCMRATTNFLKHLKRSHPSAFSELTSSKDQQVTQQPTSQQQNLVCFLKSAKKYPAANLNQREITDKLVTYIAVDLVPLSIVDSVRFRDLLFRLDPQYQVPSRKHLSTHLLQQKSAAVHAEVIEKLGKSQHVALTTDLWSNRQMKSYIGITAHGIVDWKMHSFMLACHRFTGRHTAANIHEVFEETIASFDVGHKITAIVTDNAANMINAFSLPGFTAAPPDNEQQEDSDQRDTDLDSNDDEEVLELLPTCRTACFAHTLQLVVKDGLKSAGSLTKVIAKASAIVSFVHKSTVATDILEGERKLQMSNATRWNSQVIMIQSVLRVPEEKLNSLGTTKLTTFERNTLREVVEILQPFQEATDLAQMENSVSASFVIPCIRGLRSQLQGLVEKFSCPLVKALKTSTERRLPHYETEVMYTRATVLDPRFKLKWCQDQEEKERIKEDILSIMSAIASSPHTMTNNRDTQPPPAKKSRLFSFMDTNETAESDQGTEDATELREYLQQPPIPEDSDPLHFWSTQRTLFPKLVQIAQKYLVTPASSAPVERLFSIAGKVYRPDRCSLNDSTFERLMFIRCNLK